MKEMRVLGLSLAAAFCVGLAAEAAEPAPQIDGNCKMTTPEEQNQGHAAARADSNLSEPLANCRGVLRPPSIGDDMTVPPPENGGKMPVLPPGSVPQQTPGG
jgi:hypothetical protein